MTMRPSVEDHELDLHDDLPHPPSEPRPRLAPIEVAGLVLLVVACIVSAVAILVHAGNGPPSPSKGTSPALIDTAQTCSAFDTALALSGSHLIAVRSGDAAATFAVGQSVEALRGLVNDPVDPDMYTALLATFGAYNDLFNLAAAGHPNAATMSDAEVTRADAVDVVIGLCETFAATTAAK